MINRYAIPFPVGKGKSDADAARIAKYFKAHPAEYKESRARLGTSVERAYLQTTPMGAMVIAYVETEHSFADWMKGLLTSDLEVDKQFVAMVADIHGFDLRHALDGPAPETIGEWVDPSAIKARHAGLAFVAPVVPGQEEAGRKFAHEAFVKRRAEFDASRKALKESAEVVTLNVTPMGSLICGYLEGVDPIEANRRFAASKSPYDVWFKGQLKTLFPPQIDFDKPLPPIEPLFDYVAGQRLV